MGLTPQDRSTNATTARHSATWLSCAHGIQYPLPGFSGGRAMMTLTTNRRDTDSERELLWALLNASYRERGVEHECMHCGEWCNH